ncbi:hypothetical protein M8J77_005709 [Diaphorina citri]|nr:hypothetical protein M8J77_005709 [Diaphorina citri]
MVEMSELLSMVEMSELLSMVEMSGLLSLVEMSGLLPMVEMSGLLPMVEMSGLHYWRLLPIRVDLPAILDPTALWTNPVEVAQLLGLEMEM